MANLKPACSKQATSIFLRSVLFSIHTKSDSIGMLDRPQAPK
jgi:hypothetical protein